MSSLTRALLWTVLFLVASLIGRNTIVHTNLPFVGPAVGVAFLWLASGNRSTWRTDGILIALLSFAVGFIAGGDWVTALLGVIMVGPAPAAIAWLHHTCPQVWGGGGHRPIRRLQEFGQFLLAVTTAVLVCALLRTALGVLLVQGEGWGSLALRAGRPISSMVALGTFGLLVGGEIDARRRSRDWSVPISVPRALEMLAIIGAMAAVFWVGYLEHPAVPSLFVLTLGVVWASVRFSPLTTSTLALALGVATITFTVLGFGPISNAASPEGEALITQIFVAVLTVTGMAISLSRRQLFEAIAELTRSEAVLASRAEELDLMLENLGDGVAIVEDSGRIVHANSVLRETFPEAMLALDRDLDLDAAYVRAVGEYHLFHPDGRPMDDDDVPYRRALRGELVDSEEFHLVRDADRPARIVEVSAIALPPDAGVQARAMVTVRDVTVEREQREALATFASTVAHDLNTPLTVLSGWADALNEEFESAPAVESTTGAPMLAKIRTSAERMRELISDLLAHAVASDQNISCEPVPLAEVAAELIRAHIGPGTEHDAIVADDLPEVWADRSLITQLLDNLIGNALKYVAPSTRPRVRISATPAEDGWVTVRVSDNGIGIPRDQRHRVFESFHRASGDGYRGTGLGLAICKRIVERHGGQIWITDNPDGRGVTFELTLPTTAETLAAAVHP